MEVWDLYDEKGNRTGKTHFRKDPLNNGDFHMVVENWIINSKGEYLIQKRTKPLKEYINPWSTTAGSATKGETSIIAVQRETEEEMGLSFERSDFIFIERFFFDDFFMDVYETRWSGCCRTLKFDTSEVEDVKWVTKEELQKMFNSREFFSHRTNYLSNILDEK